MKSYSQVGQDLQIAHLLGKRERIHYIDVGCLWPVMNSNSYFFSRHRGHGLCIDPNPEVAELYAGERPRDVFLNVGIGAEPAKLTYHRFKNPAFNTLSEERAADVQRRAAGRGGRRLIDQVEVSVITLDEAVARTNFAERCDGRLDFITIDVEGLEADVIGGYSFDPLRPRLVVCEYLRRNRSTPPAEESDLAAALAEHGYWVAAYTGHDVYFLDEK